MTLSTGVLSRSQGSTSGADMTTAHPGSSKASSWWPLGPSVTTPQRCTQRGWGASRGLRGHSGGWGTLRAREGEWGKEGTLRGLRGHGGGWGTTKGLREH